MNLDCSSFVQYCYWAQGLPFSAGNTAAYGRTGDLRAISPAEVQPGDLRVVYAAGGEQGHVQMALGGGAWIECCYVQRMDGEPRLPLLYLCRILRRLL